MSAQTTYSYKTAAGAAGGIVDLAPYKVDTFLNNEATGTMKFGYGVIRHSGNICKLPVAATTADKFLGITVNNRTTEFDMEGNVHIRNKAALGVMRYGRVYARVAHGLTIAAGDKLYLIITGADAGKFTNSAGETAIAVSGSFDGPADSNDIASESTRRLNTTGSIASVTFFNAPAVDNDTVDTLTPASATALGGVKVGEGLDVAADGTISVHQG